ncbi:MAG: AcvB/VirJ family lysyl-phosphatidylglycerol hydrolase [Pseudomonadota bacterium]
MGLFLNLAAVISKKNKRKIEVKEFGGVAAFHSAASSTNALFFSSRDGDGKDTAVPRAETLKKLYNIVVSVDFSPLLKMVNLSEKKTHFFSLVMGVLSHWVPKILPLMTLNLKLILCYSSGTTLAYASLVRVADLKHVETTSLGMCLVRETKEELCQGKAREPALVPNGRRFPSASDSCFKLDGVILKGERDLDCEFDEVRAFIRKIGHGKDIGLDPFALGFSMQKKGEPRIPLAFLKRGSLFKKKKNQMAEESQDSGLKDLPLIEVPYTKGDGLLRPFAFLVSGDGGWTSMNQDLASALAENGVSVIGLDSLRYFWKARSPNEFSEDLAKILTYYQTLWQREQFLLLGYSFGADVLPAAAARLPPALSRATRAISLISPSEFASFEIKALEWLDLIVNRFHPVKNELVHVDESKLVCFFGNKDLTALCPLLKQPARIIKFDEGHRMNDHAKDIAEIIIQQMYENAGNSD